MSKTATPTIRQIGKYEVSMEGIQTRLRVDKDIVRPNGDIDVKTFFVPLEKVTLALRNDRGGYVVYYMTKMGRRQTFSRTIGLPPDKVITKLATGPEYITRGGSTPMKGPDVFATIARMCGISTVAAAALVEADFSAEESE